MARGSAWKCSNSLVFRPGKRQLSPWGECYNLPVFAYVLLRLARIYGDDELERHAVGVLRLFGESLGRAPTELAHALNALDLYLATPKEIAIVGPAESDVARAALEPFDPNAVVAFGPAAGVPLLEGKALVDGKPAVYVCERFACRQPVTEAAELQPVR